MQSLKHGWIVVLLGIVLGASWSSAIAATKSSKNKRKTAPEVVIPRMTRDQEWSLLLPTDKRIALHGVVSYDKAGGSTNPMMYPAPSAAGFIAALITHGVINSSVRASEKTKIQKAADVVVEPYAAVLNDY